MKTVSIKFKDIKKDWYLIDAENLVLGRLAAFIASRLRGKHKPPFTPSIDCGDNIVVINSSKIVMTGKKAENKIHYKHTGFPGGIKETSYGTMLEGSNPEKVLFLAVKRMLPKGVLARDQIRKLHIYPGSVHPHLGQSPVIIEMQNLNKKNKRGINIAK